MLINLLTFKIFPNAKVYKVKKKRNMSVMSNRQVKYYRAENGINLAESNSTDEAVVFRRRRTGLSKLEKLLLAFVVILVFLCALLAGLYLSERQRRSLKKELISNKKGDEKCSGPNGAKDNNDKVNKGNKTMETSGSDRENTSSNDVVKQAALGRVFILILKKM